MGYWRFGRVLGIGIWDGGMRFKMIPTSMSAF